MESYAKVGRGGAGNYLSQQDVQEAAARLKEDVEAQQTKNTNPSDPSASKPEYAHAGRGGAGNFKPTAAVDVGTPADLSTSIKQGITAEAGYTGRGGAGNFRGDLERTKSGTPVDVIEPQEKAYEETAKDVEQGLQAPEKAHLGGEKLGEQ